MFLCIKGQFDKISCEMDQKIERKLDIKMLQIKIFLTNM